MSKLKVVGYIDLQTAGNGKPKIYKKAVSVKSVQTKRYKKKMTDLKNKFNG
jgi:hypothetical protein